MQLKSSPIIYKTIYFPSSKAFYDVYSKRLIVLTSNSICIYNKKGTKIIKEIALKIKLEWIQSIIVSDTIKFLLLFAISTKNETLIYCLDVENAIVFESLNSDFTSLIGMFFIYNQTSFNNLDNIKQSKKKTKKEKDQYITSNEASFCLIFKKKIIYFIINKRAIINTNTNQHQFFIKQNKILRISSASILRYQYCPQYNILCCHRSDSSFAFFNLSNEKNYFKKNKVKLVFNSNSKGTSSKISETHCEDNKPKSQLYGKNNYTKAQFYLQTILAENTIVVYRVKNLNTLEVYTEIPIQSVITATLQFVDNLILLHDFDKEKTSVYDLRMKNRHFLFYPSLPITNHYLLITNQQREHTIVSTNIIVDNTNTTDYNIKVNLNYLQEANHSQNTKYSHNTFIYNKDIVIKGELIEDLNDKSLLYFIYFDPKLFYDGYYHQHFNHQDEINCMYRRTKANNVMLQALIDMIERNNSIKLIKAVFTQITYRLYKRYKAKHLMQLSNQSQLTQSQIEQIDLEIPHYHCNYTQNTIKQVNVYSAFIKHFQHNNRIKPYYIIILLIHFSKGLIMLNLPLHVNILNTMLCFIEKTMPLSSLRSFFLMQAIPDYKDLALLLIGTKDNTANNNELFQIGIDMLIRLKEYDEIVMIMIKKQKITELLVLIAQNSKLLSKKIIDYIRHFLLIANSNYRLLLYQFILISK